MLRSPLLGCFLFIAHAAAAEPQVDYARQVQPILAGQCIACHGPKKQLGGIRFDRKADALAGGDSGKAILPGKPNESPLLHRIGANDETKMPPKGDRLPAEQVAILRKWIEQGAPWPDDPAIDKPDVWWSFQPLKAPKVPEGRNPVDELVRTALTAKKLTPAAPADRRTLVRRAYFDLIGLPPTPAQAEAFVRNDAPEAWEQLIDKLLASPRYGERWARHWLDVVHFGETHGYDKDQPRPNAWPYRDYVIRAFNSDKPYARFIQEQLAGDVLFPGTRDGIEALGFLAAGPWDLIGHVEVPESKIDGKIARHLDRDDFVSNTMGTFLGLTVHCAQCHNHKFDPISHEEYYRLQAVFAGIDRTDVTYDANPATAKKRNELTAKQAEARKNAVALVDAARAKAGDQLTVLEKLIAEAAKPPASNHPEQHGYHSQISAKAETAKWVQVDLGESQEIRTVLLRPCYDDFAKIGAGFGFPVRFKIELSDDRDFKGTPRILEDRTGADQANPGTLAHRVAVEGARGRYLRITATKLAPRQKDFIFALAEVEVLDAKGVNLAAGKAVAALDSIEAPVRWAKANLTDGKFPPEPRASASELAKLQDTRKQLIASALSAKEATELANAEKEAATISGELAALGSDLRKAYIGAVHHGKGSFTGTGATGKPRTIHVLARGNVTKPGKEVAPGVLASVKGPAEYLIADETSEGQRRAALAAWITDRENPLTYRVMANRVWQYHFGRGLVDSPNDFGKMGQAPSHPELLDALAWELREHQSLKKLHRRIMLSETYRQSSATDARNASLDSDNRSLWRQNRHKLEAEAVRDSILAVAGKLDLTMGGPSFQDFVIERPEHSPHYEYQLHDVEDRKSHRRAVYRFVVRSKQQPFMAALDCADPSLAVEKRNQTLAPQQALALLNNRLVLAMAVHFAARVEKEAPDTEARIAAAFELALGRKPSQKELAGLAGYASEHGLANACRAILNLNEFVFID